MGKMLSCKVAVARSRSVIASIKDEADKDLTGDGMRQYISQWYEKLYRGFSISINQLKLQDKWAQRLSRFHIVFSHWKSLEECLLWVVKHMRKEKAPGIDGFPMELYQKVPEIITSLARVWLQDKEHWCTDKGVIKLLHKKGSKSDINN